VESYADWNIQSPEPTEVAWAGPSDSGLADPAQCTLGRASTFFRIILAMPIAVIVGLLAIPHYIALFALGFASLVCVVIAWFAILITDRYPPFSIE